jgi:hypothetical protein
MDHLPSTASAGNIFGTPVVEYLSVPLSHFFRCLQYPEIFIPLRQTIFGNSHKSFGAKSGEG